MTKLVTQRADNAAQCNQAMKWNNNGDPSLKNCQIEILEQRWFQIVWGENVAPW